MHAAAERFVRECVECLKPDYFDFILDIGSRDINGSNRKLFTDILVYAAIDIVDGPNVDEIADGATYKPEITFSLVLCSEVLEHAENARAICRNAFDLLNDGGVFLVTAAGEGRIPHGAAGGDLAEGEFYRNVTEAELREWLGLFSVVLIDVSQPTDIYALAIK